MKGGGRTAKEEKSETVCEKMYESKDIIQL